MIVNDPQPGDIGLTRIVGPVGRLIRLGQWLNGDGFHGYTHAFLVLPNGQLIEAQPGGAVIRPLSQYDARDVVYVAPRGLSYAQRVLICEQAAKYLDVPYSFLDYVAIAAHRLRLPLPGLRRYVASSRHMICSQLVDQAYADAGVTLFTDGRWPGYATPGALFDLLAGEVPR